MNCLHFWWLVASLVIFFTKEWFVTSLVFLVSVHTHTRSRGGRELASFVAALPLSLLPLTRHGGRGSQLLTTPLDTLYSMLAYDAAQAVGILCKPHVT